MQAIWRLLYTLTLFDWIPTLINAAVLWQTGDRWAKKNAAVFFAFTLFSGAVTYTLIVYPWSFPPTQLSQNGPGLVRLIFRGYLSVTVWVYMLKLLGIRPFATITSEQQEKSKQP